MTTEAEWADLLAQAEQVDAMEGTWIDQDPDVAWRIDVDTDPEYMDSVFGRMVKLYTDAGWERCYHENSAGTLHYNVKLNGMARYRGARSHISIIEEERNHTLDVSRLEEWCQNEEELRIEMWWEDVDWDIAEIVDLDPFNNRPTIYQCGRSGGYLQVSYRHSPALVTNPVAMVKVARWLEGVMGFVNSEEAGRDLVDDALDRYDEERWSELASAREEAETW